MKNLNINENENQDCLFVKKSHCSILKTKECQNCKFYVKDTPENYQKYIVKVREDIKKYALRNNQ